MEPRWVVRSGEDVGLAMGEIRRCRGLTQEQLAAPVPDVAGEAGALDDACAALAGGFATVGQLMTRIAGGYPQEFVDRVRGRCATLRL